MKRMHIIIHQSLQIPLSGGAKQSCRYARRNAKASTLSWYRDPGQFGSRGMTSLQQCFALSADTGELETEVHL
jgi:hypothetical protein